MIEFGKTLREAREAKGYSVSQLAETTHILPQIIVNLEKEDFTKIVAPIYGRGFVKLYCETVGIEAKPLIAEFMEIYNGNRQPTIRLKEVEIEAEAKREERDEGEVTVEPEAKPEPPTFDFEAKDIPPPLNDALAQPLPHAEPFKAGPGDLPFPDEPLPKRDYRLPGYSMPEMPRRYWRFGILIAAAIAIVTLLVIGTRTLYRATMTAPESQSERVEELKSEKVEKTTTATKPSTPRAPRKGVKVPPLYID